MKKEHENKSGSDKENEDHVLLNPKKRQKKGHPLGTKHFKSSIKNKQR